MSEVHGGPEVPKVLRSIAGWVMEISSGGKTPRELVKLPGDASTRVYYRTEVSGRTYVVMKLEPFDELDGGLPFLAVRRHLELSEVDVPKIFGFDAALGFVLLEDLGDVTLLRRLQEVSNADVERHLYERVIDVLIKLQAQASPKKGKHDTSLEAFRLCFDHEKLMWEVNFTIEHFYELYLKRTISASERKTIREGFDRICHGLAREPMVLAHRDFHSRNIMVIGQPGGERFVMIDFQDARMGPAQYDLASLLKDSYYQLEETQIARLIDYYIAKLEATSETRVDKGNFVEIFDMMSVQRNFKAIGSFASFLNKRGNAVYLKYIGNTFENIRRTLLKYPEYAALREVLFHYYYF